VGQGGTATASTTCLHQTGPAEFLHDLDEMVAGKLEFLGEISRGKSPVRRAGTAHQHAESVVNEGGKAHLPSMKWHLPATFDGRDAGV